VTRSSDWRRYFSASIVFQSLLVALMTEILVDLSSDPWKSFFEAAARAVPCAPEFAARINEKQ
jgi:hypothetical protein